MPREVFIAGQILTAAEMNSVSDQTVMSFAGTASRGSAIASPVEGMTTYIEDSNSVQIYDGSAWKRVLNTTGSILQVASTTKVDSFSTTSTSMVDVTGLSVSITPQSSSSKILVLVSLLGSNTSNADLTRMNLLRGSTVVTEGTSGTVSNSTSILYFANGDGAGAVIAQFLDSPATTSSTTYKVQVATVAGNTTRINRLPAVTNQGGVSTITVMEVAG